MMHIRSKFKGFPVVVGEKKKKKQNLVEVYSSLELNALGVVFFSLEGKRANVFGSTSPFAVVQTFTVFVALQMKATL